MKLEAFLLCDAATDYQGKLNVLGAFDTIFARQVPVVHPACAVAVRVRFDHIEQGDHNFKINVINQDGKAVIPGLDGNLSVAGAREGGSTAVNLVLNIHGLKLESYGEYRIDLAVDGRQEGSLPLYLRPVPQRR